MNEDNTKCGYVALIGKPNVGKSTLMNHILGNKVSITSRKPQTTRQRVLGIKTVESTQVIYVDVPGIQTQASSELNQYMNRVAKAAIHDVDVVLFMVEPAHFDEQDELVLKLLSKVELPVFLVINKVDKVKDRAQLLPFIEKMSTLYDFKEIIPVSAKKGEHVPVLESQILSYLPEGTHFYSPEQFTDRSDKFIAAEFVREKLMRHLGQEIPYHLTVTIDLIEELDHIIKIAAVIWVDRASHKSIVIGQKGEKLKQVGTLARQDLERYFSKKVLLKLWVKVKSDWSGNRQSLQRFGYDD